MISQDEPQRENQREFESLLQRAKGLVLKRLSEIDDPSSLSGVDFERLVYEQFQQAALNTPFEEQVLNTPDRGFPDIVVGRHFGVEVKATKKDAWTSVGNSVLESSREASVKQIYVFFGKLGGEPDIAYRDYESCMKGIAVTHYPRYQINMKLADGESIFDKMNTSYTEISDSENPIGAIRKYYKVGLKKGQGLWWIDDDLDQTATADPVIKTLSSLSIEEKLDIKADLFVHFPEVFSNSIKKYEKIPAYLAAAHGVISANIRDFFSASGRMKITYNDKKIEVAHVVGEAHALWSKIANILADKTEEDLAEAWDKPISSFQTPFKAWLREVDVQTENSDLPVTFSALFENQQLDLD